MNEMIYEYTHGGDIYGANGLADKNVLDFSANINPLGIPENALNAAKQSLEQSNIYPDSGCRRLIAALAAYENVEPRHLFCSNGASDIIFRIIAARKPGKILVTAPSFADYERAGGGFGAEVVYFPLHKENGFNIDNRIIGTIQTALPDIVFLCNPNNPTGCLTRYDLLAEIAITCAEINSILVIDECFLDFVPDADRYTAKTLLTTYSNVVVLKALTKTFAMPGLRLGYAICSDKTFIDRLRLCGADWPVSNVAQAAGIAALENGREYVSKSIFYIDAERRRITDALAGMGLAVYPAYANFIFFHCSWDMDLSRELRKKGILIRDCANFAGLEPGYYRIAVLTQEKNTRLIKSLKEVQASWQSRL
ncbi:MAG: aminotransferase class I/II-fold pyridoxal phosphate-dependent enzyme [Oscillospiraceae bacterium]|nr:aminotransferase class I/II-fold pyridoxal phosphate-dependent enzyme [Oscillospiraceae bacterium]